MKDRIYMKLYEMKQDVLHKMGDMFIWTIHSFFLLLLQDYFGYGNYEVLDDKQGVKILTFSLTTYLAVDKLNKNRETTGKLDIKHLIVDEFQDLNEC